MGSDDVYVVALEKRELRTGNIEKFRYIKEKRTERLLF